MNNLESVGYNAIMDEIRISRDSAAPWGSNVAWMFALADYSWLKLGEILPGYRPSPQPISYEGLEEGSEFYTLVNGVSSEWTDADLRRVYKILSRYDDWLRLAGKNY